MNKRTRNNPPSAVRPGSAAAREVAGQLGPSSEVIVQEQTVTVQVQLPPPAMLKQYDDVRPGTGDLLVRWAEEEQAHRRKNEMMALEANIRAQERQSELAARQLEVQRESVLHQAATVRSSDLRGQYLGAALCAAAIGGAIYLGLSGQSVVATALAAIPTAAIIQSFRTLMRQEARKPEASRAGQK